MERWHKKNKISTFWNSFQFLNTQYTMPACHRHASIVNKASKIEAPIDCGIYTSDFSKDSELTQRLYR